MERQEIRTRLANRVSQLERGGRGDGHEIAVLVEAIARLETGDFGRCSECGESIGEERLLEEPTVTLCVTCASAESWRPFTFG
jgi:RNA polymerase-binding transcription factor DksA